MENKELKIFLVEDNELFANMLAESLRNQHGFSIELFPTGEEMLKKIQQNPDVVLLDYQLNSHELKSMNGGQVLKKIHTYNDKIDVVMISSFDDLENAVNLLKQGAIDYICKDTDCIPQTAKVLLHLKQKKALQKGLHHYARQHRKRKLLIAAGICLLSVLTLAFYYNCLALNT